MACITVADINDFLGLDLRTDGLATVNALIPAIEASIQRPAHRWGEY